MTEKRFNLENFDNGREVLELLNTQAEIIFDLEKENEQLKKDILRLMYTAEHLVNIKKLEEKWGIDYNQFLSDLLNGDEHL